MIPSGDVAAGMYCSSFNAAGSSRLAGMMFPANCALVRGSTSWREIAEKSPVRSAEVNTVAVLPACTYTSRPRRFAEPVVPPGKPGVLGPELDNEDFKV